jgi:6-phosphogluconolactonase (cycloisomerase 2 family)
MRRNILVEMAAVSAVLLGAPQVVHAACNLIPAARSEFPSTLGSVKSPITAPAKTVELRLTPCDSSAGFEPVAANNQVTLRFEPPGAGVDTDVVIVSGIGVSDCTLPGGRCRTLTFAAPSDTDLVVPPDGLAGPARVLVRDGANVLVAEIGELFLPTSGCDREPESVFEQFTVLPPANNFLDASDGTATVLRATVDGGGNLLVPFDYWGEGTRSVLADRPGSPIARILNGSITLDAFTSNPGVPIQVPSSDFVRSFTLDGRPLPPLLRADAAGAFLFGSADAEESVLRILQSNGGPDIYDLDDRLSAAGRGPIVIGTFAVGLGNPAPLRGLRAGTQLVSYTRDESIEGDINGDGDSADRIVQLIDAATGSELTGHTVVETQTAKFLIPALEIEGGKVAYLRQDPIFDSLAAPSNAPNTLGELEVIENAIGINTGIKGDPAASIDGRAVRLSNGLAYFLQRNPSQGLRFSTTHDLQGYTLNNFSADRGGVDYYATRTGDSSVALFKRDPFTGTFTLDQQLFNNQGGVVGIGYPFGGHLTFDDRNLYLAGYNDDALTVFERDDVTGHLSFVEAHFDGVAGVDGLDGARSPFASFDGKNIYVCGAAEDGLAVFQRDTSTGLLTFLEAHHEAGLGRCVSALPTFDGLFVYAAAGAGTPDAAGIPSDAVVVYSRNPATGALTFLESHFDGIGGVDGLDGAIGAITPFDNSLPTSHLYVTALEDSAIAIFDRDPVTGLLTFIDAVFNGDFGPEPALGGALGAALDPSGETLYVTALNDDALNLVTRDTMTGLLTPFQTFVDGVDGVDGLDGAYAPSFDPSFREVLVSSNVDLKATVFRVPAELKVYDVAATGLRPVSIPATSVAVSGDRAVVVVPEIEGFGNPNSDLDDLDDIANIYDGQDDSVISLETATAEVAITADLVALTNPETHTLHVYPFSGGMTPPPAVSPADDSDDSSLGATGPYVVFGVGTPADRRLSVYHSSGAIDSTGRPFDEFVVGDSLVAFRSPESVASADLNADGDLTDSIMHVYELSTGAITSTGQAAVPCTFGGCDPFLPYKVRGDAVAFVTREIDQGGTDLNGDGDTTDTIMQVFHRKSGTLQRIDLSGEAPTLNPFPDDYSSGTISYVQASEATLGDDIDDDGMLDDIVVLLTGDADDDGILDEADSCVHVVSDTSTDYDLDGLADACDPTPLCGDYTPLIPPSMSGSEAACQKAVGKGIATYLKNRSKASQRCLDSLAKGDFAGEPKALCIGGGLADGDILPADAKAAKKADKARAKLRKTIDAGCATIADIEACGDDTDEAHACLSAAVGSAAEASLVRAYGSLGASTPASALACQKAMGGSTVKYLSAVVKATTGCLNRINDGSLAGNAQVLCLGKLDQGSFELVLPTDQKTSDAITKAEGKLRDAMDNACLDGGDLLAMLDACGPDTPQAADCLLCTSWRQVAEIVRAGYGPR